MLETRHLSVSYGEKRVLSDVSLRVERGEMLCVGGESGSGKTTLLRALLGFVDWTGEILVDGQLLSAETVAEVRRSMAYVPQELALPCDTVREMVRMPFGLRANRNVVFSEDMLLEDWKRLGLEPELMEKRVHEVSGGQRQRIMLSVAGCLGKPLLLADEPTSALDEESARLVLGYFRLLARERGMAMLVVSHSPVMLGSGNVLMLTKDD